MFDYKAIKQVYHSKTKSVWVANFWLATVVTEHTTTGHNIRFPLQTVASIVRATDLGLTTVVNNLV
ncbi:hypothetical protein J6590_083718 [Homalodisca vitripennis]|nr:hypothetical protein J6590_083718 [Homalodisca vitripennis]